MEIKKATKEDKKEAIKIAEELNEWFTTEGVKNMRLDFELNDLIVAKENENVLGFLCYSSDTDKIKIIWMGVKREKRGKGIGKKILEKLEKKAKEKNLSSILVETLTDKDNYEYYKSTREFYYKNGFKKIAYKKAKIKGWDDQVVLEKKMGG